MSARLDVMTPAKNEWARDASNECVNSQFPTSNFQSTLSRSTLSSLGVGDWELGVFTRGAYRVSHVNNSSMKIALSFPQ